MLMNEPSPRDNRISAVLARLGECSLLEGDPVEAVETLEDALQRASALPEDALNPRLWILGLLGKALAREGDVGGAVGALQEEIALRKKLSPDDEPGLASAMARASLELLKQGSRECAQAAVPWLRECLAIRERCYPDGHAAAGLRFNAMSILGEALLRSQCDDSESAKLTDEGWDEIERLLIEGQAGQEREAERIPASERARVRAEALTRLVDFYEARHRAAPQGGFDAQAESWRARLAEYEATTQAAAASQPAAAAASSP